MTVCLCHSLYTLLNDSRHLIWNIILGSYYMVLINLKVFPLEINSMEKLYFCYFILSSKLFNSKWKRVGEFTYS